MSYSTQIKEKVRQLRTAGVRYDEIPVKVEHLLSLPDGTLAELAERTMIRWVKDSTNNILPAADITPAKGSPDPDWPEERRWLGWGVEDLADVPGITPPEWEAHLATIRTAQALGNLHVAWFYRRFIETLRRKDAPTGHPNWALALAALPVIGDMLRCPPCNELAELIDKHRPWQGGMVTRQIARKYRRETRGVSDSIKQCCLVAQAKIVFGGLAMNTPTTGPKFLEGFAEHVPFFDRIRRGSPARAIVVGGIKLNFGGIVLGILAQSKGIKGED